MDTRKKRIGNKLSLGDKVRVIRAYLDHPCYKDLSNIFKCSNKQIKRIFFARRKILAQHALRMRSLQNLDYKKFELMHKVMFEWYQRAKCYANFGPITYKIIRERILDARKALNIGSFIPTNTWLVNFRKDCDRHPPERTNGNETLLPLDMTVIAKFVLQTQGFTIEQMKLTYGIGADENVPMESASSCHSMKVLKTQPNPFNIIEIDSDEDEISENGVDKNVETSDNADEKDYSFIKSSQEALKYLKPLENFVLLRENFRAIGLITQLEAIFLKTSKG